MCFVYISKAGTGLIVRTPIIISPHPPPAKPKDERYGSKVRMLGMCSKETFAGSHGQSTHVCVWPVSVFLLHVAGMMKQTEDVYLEKPSSLLLHSLPSDSRPGLLPEFGEVWGVEIGLHWH